MMSRVKIESNNFESCADAQAEIEFFPICIINYCDFGQLNLKIIIEYFFISFFREISSKIKSN